MKMKSSFFASLLSALIASEHCHALPADNHGDASKVSETATPTARVNRFGFAGEQTATFKVNGPDVTLSPNVHWSLDTKRTDNVVPLPPQKRSQIYYGVGDAFETGQYAMTSYHFDHDSVNLDHTDHLSQVKYEDGRLTMSFSLEEAYQLASDHWRSGLILITYTEGCGDYDKGERCYFHASDLSFDDDRSIVTAKGESRHPDEVSSAGETEWGIWSPTTASAAQVGQAGAGFEWNQANGSQSSHTWAKRDEGEFGPTRNCNPPEDARFHLPTSCLDEWFDQDLDDKLGYQDMTQAFGAFVATIDEAEAAGGDDPFGGGGPFEGDDEREEGNEVDDDFLARRSLRPRAIQKRGLFDWLRRKTLQVLARGYRAVKNALTITASINKDLAWKLPQPSAKAFDPDKLQDKKLKQVKSPWGDSILLKSFNNEKLKNKKFAAGLERESGRESYMNIYCVGCGVSGSARVAGRAKWTIEGFEEGFIDVRADMKIAMKLGIDAQIAYKTDFTQPLFDIGLPGLSYGVVTIGPRISVESKVGLEAAANGKLLAGAEMGIENAHARINFVQKGAPSEQSGWKPYFKPTFQASGEIAVSSSLGFPISLACGIKAGGFDKSVKLINEPSIKFGAQVAGSFGTNSNGKVQGVWSGDIEETEGCKGISTALSWRNEIKVDIVDLAQFSLHDTDDQKIKSGCIGIPTGQSPDEANKKPDEANKKAGKKPPPAAVAQPGGRQPPKSRQKRDTMDIDRRQEAFNPNDVQDITDDVRGNELNLITYEIEPFEVHQYVEDKPDSLAYSTLRDPDDSTLVISCSNGNVYAVMANSGHNDACSELWSMKSNVIVADGAFKALHYYEATMAAAGVSRLRVSDAHEMPKSGVPTLLALYTNPANQQEQYYVAVDSKEEVYYPLVCDFVEEHSGSKVFLAKDPEQGIKTLQSPDVEHSITGGQVRGCFPLVLGPSRHDDGGFISPDHTEEVQLETEPHNEPPK
ncbi:hypothetical protein HIM_00332 [Hirsutella minnesotensis 3608]|nr:hypothetical protein HIM_00332 [Hirsutella minnesotensis 3608]